MGPNVEFMFPNELNENAQLKDGLPFLALPDGAHAVRLSFLSTHKASLCGKLMFRGERNVQRDEDYTYFHLHLPNLLSTTSPSPSSSSTSPLTSTTANDSVTRELNETVFGISCNRQINSTELLNKGAEITRSTVQKAIVILASKVRPFPPSLSQENERRAYFSLSLSSLSIASPSLDPYETNWV